MPNVGLPLIGDRYGVARFDARCRRGADQSRDHDQSDVQRGRCPELRQRPESRAWQLRRARFEWVQIKHDERVDPLNSKGRSARRSTQGLKLSDPDLRHLEVPDFCHRADLSSVAPAWGVKLKRRSQNSRGARAEEDRHASPNSA